VQTSSQGLPLRPGGPLLAAANLPPPALATEPDRKPAWPTSLIRFALCQTPATNRARPLIFRGAYPRPGFSADGSGGSHGGFHRHFRTQSTTPQTYSPRLQFSMSADPAVAADANRACPGWSRPCG